MKRKTVKAMRYLLVLQLIAGTIQAQPFDQQGKEPYRPLVHFSPKAHWMNDPNGMVYHNGIYHLFFQYYPDSTVWGPMHWGHAISTDMIHWTEQAIALYPDSLGYIFSGSAVADKHNTSGFGKKGQAPLVAIFTHHDPASEKEGHTDFQNQSLNAQAVLFFAVSAIFCGQSVVCRLTSQSATAFDSATDSNTRGCSLSLSPTRKRTLPSSTSARRSPQTSARQP